MSTPTAVRQKMSVTVIAGYRCAVCTTETVVHNPGAPPPACLNCDAPLPALAWKNLVKDTTVVEVLPFAD